MVARRPTGPADEEIRGAIVRALARAGSIREFDIVHVDVENGEVLLSGVVSSTEERRSAGEIARQISGVSRVDNRITVATTGSSP
jgi:osmotically-inducible protein OsmY